jgi:hypothetical protein
MKRTRKPVTLMCVQPCILYYAWQIEVMLTNFQNIQIDSEFDIECLFAFNKNEPDWEEKVALIKKVESKFEGVAKFFYYEDTRQYPISYISSIRPNVLKQHFNAFADLKNETIFYHDCDIIFAKFPIFLHNYQRQDNNWYVSDTVSYIGYEYIKSKGDDVLFKMCDIVGIDPIDVQQRQLQSGGAQYIMKGVDYNFFHKVEKDCERMYKEISELNQRKKTLDPTHHEIQIWTSDMWCILWNAWLRGYNTNVIKEMDFSWAIDPIEKYDTLSIFHNAGVVGNEPTKVFYKGLYTNKLPYYDDLSDVDETKCSKQYANLIMEVAKNSCLTEKI